VLRAEHDPAGERLSGGRQGCERRGRGRVLDVAVPLPRQSQQLCEPVHRHDLELGRGRRGPPENLGHVEGRRQKLGQDPRLRPRRREVGEEPGMLPVGDPRQQDLVEVAEHGREGLAHLGRRLREGLSDLPGLDLGQHRQFTYALEVGRRPLERRRTIVAKAHPSSFLICAHVRVFSTCSFVSHARRACPTPSSG